MLVKTAAIKFSVDVRDVRVENARVVVSGAANVVPYSIEMDGRELLSLSRRLLRPKVIGLMLKALFAKH